MAEYLITLALDVDPGQGDPAAWDWTTLLDTPYPVTVIATAERVVVDPDAVEKRSSVIERLRVDLLVLADYFRDEMEG